GGRDNTPRSAMPPTTPFLFDSNFTSSIITSQRLPWAITSISVSVTSIPTFDLLQPPWTVWSKS
uniref:Uncharacterized protein n=1 Tax=Catagonus wagneri TaxID=51154 RepID=A0A8C3YQ31_9CETA